MRFTVIWTPFALDQLAHRWLNSSDRKSVTAAQHQIDQLLRVDAHTLGMPFFGDRILAIPPLRVRFTVNWDDMMVDIIDVW